MHTSIKNLNHAHKHRKKLELGTIHRQMMSFDVQNAAVLYVNKIFCACSGKCN